MGVMMSVVTATLLICNRIPLILFHWLTAKTMQLEICLFEMYSCRDVSFHSLARLWKPILHPWRVWGHSESSHLSSFSLQQASFGSVEWVAFVVVELTPLTGCNFELRLAV